jgi:hypothetical protein
MEVQHRVESSSQKVKPQAELVEATPAELVNLVHIGMFFEHSDELLVKGNVDLRLRQSLPQSPKRWGHEDGIAHGSKTHA